MKFREFAIQSMLDDDLYKCTMQQAVLKLYPDAQCVYAFKNRGAQKFTPEFLTLFKEQIKYLAELKANDDELQKLSELTFIKPWYVDFLRNYRYNLNSIEYGIDDEGQLNVKITGPWHREILWEVKLMAIISHCFFQLEYEQGLWTMEGQKEKLQLKTNKLASAKCKYADFGTRRRRCFEIQEQAVEQFKNYWGFLGTSNVHLAFKHDVKPIGTMAHEWVQGISALESLNHANRVACDRWAEVYGTELLVFLTDTFGSKNFLKDFTRKNAILYSGVRHDSDDPFKYADMIVAFYRSIDIDPMHKFIVFSDGLDADLAARIQHHCDKIGINCSFGIGTNFTNDFDTKALNMVIKLLNMDGNPVVKLSDNPGKANGDPKAVEMVRWLYGM